MTTKMIARQASVLVGVTIAASACHKSYRGAGLRGDFDLSGTYVVVAHPVADECRDVRTDPVESRLDAQHRPGELQLTIVFEGDAYPVSVRRDGRFTSSGVRRPRGGTTENVSMRGHFGDSTIRATLEVKRDPVRTVLPTSRRYTAPACRYRVNISGTRAAEPTK
jgi:hypothetical protein